MIDELTKKERYFLAVRGEEVDRPPIWIMRQAGRYMPQYRALRERYHFRDFCLNPEIAAEATLLPLELLDIDIMIIFNDILIPLEEMGLAVEFPEGGPRIMSPLAEEADLDRFQAAAFDRPAVADSIALAKERAGGDVPILGFCGSPFTMAAYAVEGRMSKTQYRIKGMLFQSPLLLQEILKRITETVLNYLVAQVEGGADGVQIFESWGGILAMPRDYEDFAAKYQRDLISGFRERCPGVPVHLYVRGSNGRLASMKESGADVISIDWTTPLAEARRETMMTLQGNLDPMVLLSERAVGPAFQNMIEGFDWRRGWIANLGHGITPEADVAAARKFVECVQHLAGEGAGA